MPHARQDSAAAPLARALPAAPRVVASAVGDAASPTALARLTAALEELKRLRLQAVMPILREALDAMRADRAREGAELALKALELDEECAIGWHILGICLEKSDDFTASLKCYERALALSPEDPEVANDLGRLAYRLGLKDVAEALFLRYLEAFPDSADGVNNLAAARRDQMRFEDAIETLRPAIQATPGNPLLWNTLGTVLAEQGEMQGSLVFFDEALRLDAGFAKARYNRSNVWLALGHLPPALADCEAAIQGVVLDSETAMMRLARALMLVAGAGDLGQGWDDYEVRFDPHYADVTHFLIDRPAWTPQTAMAGKRMLMIGEQGLGDEVLFANVVLDVIEALGPSGKLVLAVEHRLVPLFARSFPTAEVVAHGTAKVTHHVVRGTNAIDNWEAIDLWAPLASPLRRFRRSVDAFPSRARYLAPDAARVEHWRGVLDALPAGPKVGVVWKSLYASSGRARYFSPFEAWRPILTTPGAVFVNLQYGECADELLEAKAALGIEVHTLPGIDLKDDLDDLAALTTALDLVVGPANATTNIAAAAGADVWFVSTPGAWPRLGTERYPWYPQARVFTPPAYNDWAPAMDAVAAALAERVRHAL